ncbi:hypothetical protein HYO05_22930 [Vibrio parahaemolyticus]|uniref:hypothetical protein n=1 Tax=Vibrio parahaemolyticus TaxID=670 RepID=UPI00084B87E2|nr:hypothetical protein [Vibrio parahaemolyticus]EGQ8047441.1 hypothetical protein [Vibrio parahaemolyticus]EHH2867612.1 hypothetical protein [Vibrio parahaemolyticus]EIQ7476512.1 hypothetical protein [Vibrio parahaemolyticus]ELA9316644.1 hypothetical protein [Vibrio parahaemolyticus]MBE3761927.1 hypothetical protein [Vibrio parahaemolyticus]
MLEKQYEILETLYSNVSSKELKRRISKFKNDVKGQSDRETLTDELKNVLFLGEKLRVFSVPLVSRVYKSGSRFFRARVLDINSQKTLSSNDFWEAPEAFIDKVKLARANYERQPLLYVSASDPITCELEARVSEGDHYLLVGYLVKGDIQTNTIGLGKNKPQKLSSSTIKKMRILNNFIKETYLSKDDDAYKCSSIISNEIISTIDNCHGIAYPSTLKKNGINLCLSRGYRERLNIDVIFQCQKINDSTAFSAIFILENERIVEILDDWETEESKAKKFLEQFWGEQGVERASKELAQRFTYNVM